MRRYVTIIALLAPLTIASAALALREPAERVKDTSFKRLRIDTSELVSELGLDIYKWQVSIPMGQEFRLAWRETSEKGATPRIGQHFEFKQNEPGPTVIRVSLIRSDLKLGGALLGDHDKCFFASSAPAAAVPAWRR